MRASVVSMAVLVGVLFWGTGAGAQEPEKVPAKQDLLIISIPDESRDDFEIRAEQQRIYRAAEPRVSVFRGNVVVKSDTTYIRADSIVVWEYKERVVGQEKAEKFYEFYAEGNVKVIQNVYKEADDKTKQTLGNRKAEPVFSDSLREFERSRSNDREATGEVDPVTERERRQEEIRTTRRVLTMERFYFSRATATALIEHADIITRSSGGTVPLVIQSKRMLVHQGEYVEATDVKIGSGEIIQGMRDGRYGPTDIAIDSPKMTVHDTPMERRATFQSPGIELFGFKAMQLPFFTKDLNEKGFAFIRRLQIGTDDGGYIKTTWDFQQQNIGKLSWLEWRLRLDHYFDHGMGWGVYGKYGLEGERHRGKYIFYFLNDSEKHPSYASRYGTDRNGREYWSYENPRQRGRAYLFHRTYDAFRELRENYTMDPAFDDFLQGWRFEGGLSKQSDQHFLRQFAKEEYYESLQPETFLYFRRARENEGMHLLATWNLNDDFQAMTTYYPQLRYTRIADALPGGFYNSLFAHAELLKRTYPDDDLAYYFDENGNVVIHEPPSYQYWGDVNDVNRRVVIDRYTQRGANVDGARFDVKDRLSRPFNAGIFRFNPWIEPRVTGYSWDANALTQADRLYWNTRGNYRYPRQGETEGSKIRATLRTGLDISTSVHRVYPNARLDFFDIHGIRHSMDFGVKTDATLLNTTSAQRLPYFDDEVDNVEKQIGITPEFVNRIETARYDTAYDPETQTSRKTRYIVDWLTTRVSATYYPRENRDNVRFVSGKSGRSERLLVRQSKRVTSGSKDYQYNAVDIVGRAPTGVDWSNIRIENTWQPTRNLTVGQVVELSTVTPTVEKMSHSLTYTYSPQTEFYLAHNLFNDPGRAAWILDYRRNMTGDANNTRVRPASENEIHQYLLGDVGPDYSFSIVTLGIKHVINKKYSLHYVGSYDFEIGKNVKQELTIRRRFNTGWVMDVSFYLREGLDSKRKDTGVGVSFAPAFDKDQSTLDILK